MTQTPTLSKWPDYSKVFLLSRFTSEIVEWTFLIFVIAILMVIIVLLNENWLTQTLAETLVLLAILYELVADGIHKGRSFGKRVLRLIVIHLPTNQPCTLSQSTRRKFLQFVNLFYIIEFFFVVSNNKGRGLGDRWAKTQVVYDHEYFLAVKEKSITVTTYL